jgi:hypothetical protein
LAKKSLHTRLFDTGLETMPWTINLCYVISEFCRFPCRWRCPQGWAEQNITFFPYAV